VSSQPSPLNREAASVQEGARWRYEHALSRLAENIRGLEARRAEISDGSEPTTREIGRLRDRLAKLTERAYANITGWQTVQIARHAGRPILSDYVTAITRGFVELAGDRSHGNDRAILAGFATMGRHKVMLIGHNKGRETDEKIANFFGCAHPEGFRKALRAMKLAEKFGLPVVSFIDTPGAYPGIGAEERGAAQAIALNLMEMARLKTPIVCVVLGEGGSGGALGIGVGDRTAMLRHAYYSVISPEGCAGILCRDGRHKQQAADLLRIRAVDLKDLGIIDSIIEEPLGGAHNDPRQAARAVEKFITQSLSELKSVPPDRLLTERHRRLRHLGDNFTRLRLAAAGPENEGSVP